MDPKNHKYTNKSAISK